MATEDIRCMVCGEMFSWGYWNEMFNHQHSRFECPANGKMYEFQIKLQEADAETLK